MLLGIIINYKAERVKFFVHKKYEKHFFWWRKRYSITKIVTYNLIKAATKQPQKTKGEINMYDFEFNNDWTLGEHETCTIGGPSFGEYECGFGADSISLGEYECGCDYDISDM